MNENLRLFQQVFGNQPLSAIQQLNTFKTSPNKKLKTTLYVAGGVLVVIGIYAIATKINEFSNPPFKRMDTAV